MYGEIQKTITAEITARRERAQRIAEQNHREACQQNPELQRFEEIRNAIQIRKGYLRLHREIPEKVAGRIRALAPELLTMDIPALDARTDKLTRQYEALLTEAGIESSAFKPAYTCAVCKDTGYLPEALGGGVCSCYRVLLAEKLRTVANLPSDYETFDRFRADCYPDQIDPKEYGISVSPRTHMLQMKAHCEEFVENFRRSEMPNLLFIGRAGVGKTFLSSCIASALLDQGIPVLYMPVSQLFRPFAAAAFASDEERELLWHMKEMILNVELLIIDDLGTEKQTATRYEEVLEILNTREMNGRKRPCKTIITTNMSPQNLFDTYGERVASRILGSFDILRFCGDDIRLIKFKQS